MLKTLRKSYYGFLFWVTLGIGVVFSIFTPMLQYFRFLYLVPLMAMVVNKSKIVLIGFVIFSLVYVLNPSFYREDWKTLVSNLPESVYMIDSFGDPVRYYNHKIKIFDLRTEPKENKITVIPYGKEIHGFDHEKFLTNLGYKKIKAESYREIYKEDWIR